MSQQHRITIINGPNLNLLGQREPHIYGNQSLKNISEHCKDVGKQHAVDVTFLQSNFEGQIVEWIQQAINDSDALIINAAGYTHTSIAIHDALKIYPGYKVELHISNPHQREYFRHHSYVSLAVDAVVAGLGVDGYYQVIETLSQQLKLIR